jgi:DNA repair protein SbcC/Rad50
MRPLFLKMTAFGPFSGTEEIDFQKLGENPLFLINGPTGSGKTTLLDAICYALYGKSTGDEREGSQMRCDLAEAETFTEVELTFELLDKSYRIERSPEQVRPKARGEGVTSQPPKARLYELISGGEERLIVSGKVTEATAEIEALTGLNADQFRQVMVLPQGRFRQLLMAESKDREQIFSNLFQTRIYKKLEDALKTSSTAIRREVEKQNQISQGILKGVELEDMEALIEEVELLATQKGGAAKEKQEKEKLFLKATTLLQAGQGLFNQFNQLESTRIAQNKLLVREQEIQKKQENLKKGEQALKLSPVLTDVNRCQGELSAARKKMDLAFQLSQSSRKALDEAEEKLKSIDSLSNKADQHKKELNNLESYLDRSVKLSAARDERQKAEIEERTTASSSRKTGEYLQEISKKKKQLEQEQGKLQEQQAGLSGLQIQLKDLSDSLKTKAELEEKQKSLVSSTARLSKLEQAGKKLAEDHESIKKKSLSLEMEWHQGQAAILANELNQGQACPVCGSTTHPSPAQSSNRVPTESDLKKTRLEEQAASEKLTAARVSYSEEKKDKENYTDVICQLTAKLGEYSERPLEELKQQKQGLETSIQSLLNQQKRIVELAASLDKIKNEESKAQQKLDEVNLLAGEKKSNLAGKTAGVESAEKELPEEYRKPGVLEDRIKETKQEIEKKDQEMVDIRKTHQDCMGNWKAAEAAHASAVDANQQAGKSLEQAGLKWETAIHKSRFESEQDYQEALLDEDEIRNFREEIETYEKQVNLVKGAFEQQISALEGKDKPDMEKLKESLNKAEVLKTETEKAWQLLESRYLQLETTQKKLKKSSEDRKKLEDQYALIGTLSDVANGQTGNKVSLQRFVLSVLLDDVLVEASHRLRLMSKGRYQLLRKEERAKGGRASGLDLEVEDAYSGKVRPVATLSGGESFMAALAMALGLSDVVQAYAGGIRLDTLFIDEGFGSLDPESLDLAIRTLIDLQSSGRMIGIISHVPDLQEQMSTRIEVMSGQSGSSIRLVR